MTKHDQEWSPRRQRLFARWPAAQRLVRWRTYWGLEARAPMFVRLPVLAKLVQRMALRELARAVPDPETRARLTPDYTIGCKRILLSNDYWPSFARDDVSLVTDPIVRVEPDAVVTADGARHQVDVLVLGTGFDVSGSTDRIDIRGLDGRTLREAWSGGMHTNLGITVAGFPELYLLLGPNTGLGHNSVVTMIELATGYVLKAIDEAGGGARVTTRAAQDAFTREMLARSKRTIWATGCRSWYLDRFGNNTSLWPGSTVSYWWRTRKVDPSHFALVDSTPSGPPRSTPTTFTPTEESVDAQAI